MDAFTDESGSYSRRVLGLCKTSSPRLLVALAPSPVAYGSTSRFDFRKEWARLRALRQYDILDTPSEETFDRLTNLASEFFGVEVAYVSFLDADRQWFKSTVGLHRQDIPLHESMCEYTLERGERTLIEDAAEEDLLSDRPLVRDDGLRFYAGTPLTTPDGHIIGTFCIMDSAPRQLSEREAERLDTFAEMAMNELQLRRERQQHQEAMRRLDAVFQDPNVLMGVLAPDGTLIEVNATALQYVDREREEVLGKPFWDTKWWSDRIREDVKRSIEQAARGDYVNYEAEIVGADGSLYSVEGMARPVFDGDEVVSVIVSGRDVTQRQRSEARYRALAENFPDGAVGVYDEKR